MIIGFSKHYGVGGSGPVLDYLTGYLVNGEARATQPEVVRGDVKSVASLIDSLPFKRRYSSGVLSFAPEDNVTPEAQEEIMNRFEGAAFAGLPHDRRSIVWIKHTDKGRHELHFVVPRVDLGTRKSLNIAPPTPASRDLLDTLRTSINLRYGFRDPNDPECKRDVSIPAHIAKAASLAERLGRSPKPDIRQAITDRLLEQAHAGHINNRADVLNFLREQGLTITRSGINYFTILHPETGERVRLKGNIYREHFRIQDLEPAPTRHDPARLLEVDRRLQTLTDKRAAYHRARYAVDEPVMVAPASKETYDRTGNQIAPTRATDGGQLPGTRPPLGGDTRGLEQAAEHFSSANHELEHACQQLDDAHRTVARDFDAALSIIDRETEAEELIRRYAGASQSQVVGHEMELEMERVR